MNRQTSLDDQNVNIEVNECFVRNKSTYFHQIQPNFENMNIVVEVVDQDQCDARMKNVLSR